MIETSVMKELKMCIKIISPALVHWVCAVYQVSRIFVEDPWVNVTLMKLRCVAFSADIQVFHLWAQRRRKSSSYCHCLNCSIFSYSENWNNHWRHPFFDYDSDHESLEWPFYHPLPRFFIRNILIQFSGQTDHFLIKEHYLLKGK